jgi:hypothetical protein
MSDQPPIIYTSADLLLEITSFPAVLDVGSGKPMVRVEIMPRWALGSIPQPIQVAVALGDTMSVAESDGDGHSVDGTVQLRSMPAGELAVFVDLQYGDSAETHELEGVVALVAPPS